MQSTTDFDLRILKENRYAIFFEDLDDDLTTACAKLADTRKRLFVQRANGAWSELMYAGTKLLGFRQLPDQERTELWNL